MGWPQAYEYTVGADTFLFQQEGRPQPPILHLKLFDPLDDQYGMPPLAAGQSALDTHNVASGWNKALLDNSARPSGAPRLCGGRRQHDRCAVRSAEAGA